MSVNLLETLKSQVVGTLAGQASSYLGESEDNVRSGLGDIFPTLLGSVMNKASDESGAESIMNLINGIDDNLVDNITSVFQSGGDYSPDGIIATGGAMLSSLMGSKFDGIVDLVSGRSGMSTSNTSSLFKMALPFLMSMIGKKMSGSGVSGLMSLLGDQKDSVNAALPAGLSGMLGALGSVGVATSAKEMTSSATETVSDTVAASTATADSGGPSIMKWLLPLILLAVLGVLLYNMCGDEVKADLNKVRDKTTMVVDSIGESLEDGVDEAGDQFRNAGEEIEKVAYGAANWTEEQFNSLFENVDDDAQADLDQINMKEGSAGDDMYQFIQEANWDGDPVFIFDDLKYKSGSAELDASSIREIEDVKAIMMAYPTLKVRLEGHTDNRGDVDTNMKLSQSRAEAVMKKLIDMGISQDRVEAKGYGASHPIAPNDTEAGRLENRRTSVRIIK